MSKNEKQINDHIKNAFKNITPDKAEEIWNTPVEKADSNAWFLKENTFKNKRTVPSYVAIMVTAAACIILAVTFRITYSPLVSAIIYLDVNPSITIEVDKNNKVIKVSANNDDGSVILEDMDLKNKEADEAVDIIIEAMVKNGYLTNDKNALLISVDSKDEEHSSSLEQKISQSAGKTIATYLDKSIILCQSINTDDDDKDMADKYNITPGKAALIKKLVSENQSWSASDLASMPMSTLLKYCMDEGVDISEYLGEYGQVIGDIDDLEDIYDEDDIDDDDSEVEETDEDNDDIDDESDDDDDLDNDDSDDDNDSDDDDSDDDDSDDDDSYKDDGSDSDGNDDSDNDDNDRDDDSDNDDDEDNGSNTDSNNEDDDDDDSDEDDENT